MKWVFAVYSAIVVAVIVHVLRRKRVPSVAAAWALTVILFPVAGMLLYLLAGYRRREGQARPEQDRRGRRPLETLLLRECGSEPTLNNRISLLHNGNNAFSALIASLQRASRSIHMEYYIFRDDRIGRTISDILMRKARSGVEVRVIYDAIGSWGLSRRAIRCLRDAGVRIFPFRPLRFPWFRAGVGCRNHRKIVVVDGKTAYLGGINIAKYYLDGDDLGKWRDEHLRIEGDAVADLQRLFAADWQRVGGGALRVEEYLAGHGVSGQVPIQIAWAEEGPSRCALTDAFAAAILAARQRVRICSPYFMPPPLVMDAIRIAARSGVQVEVMVPASSDSHFTDLVSESFLTDLLEAGAEVFRYGKGFLHAKLLVVDERVASVGTANMDYRSLEDNLEVTAFIYHPPTVRSLAETFDRDRAACTRLDTASWERRSLWRSVAGDLMRPLAPLL